MRRKLFGFSVMVLVMMVGPAIPAASATEVYKYTTPSANDVLAEGSTFSFKLVQGTSALIKDTLGGANDTCTEWEIHGHHRRKFLVVRWLEFTTFDFTKCSHTTTTLANGSMELKNIAGTTNATVVSQETRITVKSTVFGISCVANTGAGTTIGTLTGAKSSTGYATMDINGVITLENGCGDSTLSASGTVTSPTGLTIEES